jgi:hypothetical protein
MEFLFKHEGHKGREGKTRKSKRLFPPLCLGSFPLIEEEPELFD